MIVAKIKFKNLAKHTRRDVTWKIGVPEIAKRFTLDLKLEINDLSWLRNSDFKEHLNGCLWNLDW